MAQLVIVVGLALGVVNAGYGFDGTFSRLSSFQFVSRHLAGNKTSGEGGNRWATSCFGELRVPLPRQYLIGLDVQAADLESANRPSYLRGEWRQCGWWYYYLYGLVVKSPIGTLFLLTAGFVCAVFWRRDAVTWQDQVTLLLPVVSLLGAVSVHTSFNHHLRYVLPVSGYCFVFAAQSARYFTSNLRILRVAVAVATASVAASSLAAYPHSLSYFNEAAGGAQNGPRHLLGSSVDCGQDLLALKDWIERRIEASPFYLAYSGGFDPCFIGLTYELARPCPNGVSGADFRRDLKPGRYAISANYLFGDTYHVPSGDGARTVVPSEGYAPYGDCKLVKRVGSIFVFRVE